MSTPKADRFSPGSPDALDTAVASAADTAGTSAAEEAEGAEGAVTKPFAILHLRREQTRAGYFRPDARLVITSALRTSGLLLALPEGELKSLLFLLSFLSPNGWCRPTAPELAAAMQVSEAEV